MRCPNCNTILVENVEELFGEKCKSWECPKCDIEFELVAKSFLISERKEKTNLRDEIERLEREIGKMKDDKLEIKIESGRVVECEVDDYAPELCKAICIYKPICAVYHREVED